MPVFRIQVNFYSRDVFELPGGFFDAGGVHIVIDRPSLTEAIQSALIPAKAKLVEDLSADVVESLSFDVEELGDNEEQFEVPFYFRPEGESSFSVRVDKLELMKREWEQSSLFDSGLAADTLTLRPLQVPGFTIEIVNGGKDYEVWLCGWHDHVKTIEEVRQMCWWLFTSLYRIGREACNGQVMIYWLEIFGEEGWQRFSQVCCASPYEKALWEPKRGQWERTYYHQNIYPAVETVIESLTLDKDGHPPGCVFGELRFGVEQSVMLEEGWGYWNN